MENPPPKTQCWICGRTAEDLTKLGYDNDGKPLLVYGGQEWNTPVCVVCQDLARQKCCESFRESVNDAVAEEIDGAIISIYPYVDGKYDMEVAEIRLERLAEMTGIPIEKELEQIRRTRRL